MKGTRETLVFEVLIVVEPDEGSFHSYAPALKGLHSCGDTEEEALQNARDAAAAYLQSLIKHGDPIPVGVEASIPQQPSAYRSEHLRVACAI
ncbi:MAG: type II toxin-antitoxin system HicB family antitoxin [Chloroflexi bacterium]|nr:type II toxin-antitoxin system HicB family antitoxin [Chloroflexota bacterium]